MTESRERKTATFSRLFAQAPLPVCDAGCCRSEVQDFNFYHIFFTTSLPFLICLHSWGTPEGTRMLHTYKTSLTFSPAKPCSRFLPRLGKLSLAMQGIKQKERRKSFKSFSGQGWNHRRRSSLNIQERSE